MLNFFQLQGVFAGTDKEHQHQLDEENEVKEFVLTSIDAENGKPPENIEEIVDGKDKNVDGKVKNVDSAEPPEESFWDQYFYFYIRYMNSVLIRNTPDSIWINNRCAYNDCFIPITSGVNITLFPNTVMLHTGF